MTREKEIRKEAMGFTMLAPYKTGRDQLVAYEGFVAGSQGPDKTIKRNTLHLPLKKEWYEMIESGVKLEVYREIKPYWIQRLLKLPNGREIPRATAEKLARCNAIRLKLLLIRGYLRFKHYDDVRFSYGYSRRQMYYPCIVYIGKVHAEWGAPEEEVFIIKLGKRIE